MTAKAKREKMKSLPCDSCATATTCAWSCDLFHKWAEDMTSEETADAVLSHIKKFKRKEKKAL